MPISITIDSPEKLVIAKCRGDILENEFVNAFQKITSDPGYQATFNEIWDVRETTSMQLSFDNWQWQNNKTPQNNIREAIVIANEAQHQFASNYAQVAVDTPLNVRIFNDYNEAMNWLTEGVEES